MAFRKISSSESRTVGELTSRFCRAVSPQMASTSTPAGRTMRQRPPPSRPPRHRSPAAPSADPIVTRDLELDEALFDRRSSSRLQCCTIMPSFMITAFVAYLLDVAQQVGADENIHPVLVLHFFDELEHAAAGGGIEAVGRFVQHHQLGPVHDRLGKLRHLLHPIRVGSQLPAPRLSEPHIEQHFVRLLERALGGRPDSSAI